GGLAAARRAGPGRRRRRDRGRGRGPRLVLTRGGRVSLGAALFFLAFAATLVTAVLVVRARTPDLVLEVIEPPASDPAAFSPGGPPPNDVQITFFVREDDGHALFGIVDSHEDLVRTLDSDVALGKHRRVTYT